MLSIINNNEIKNELKQFAEKNKISDDEVICSLVYEFARKLPYSMDYMDEDFVPGMFLNVSPLNPIKYIFKEYNSLYSKMVNWGDTKKSGLLLQICNIFQAMLMGNFPSNYELTKEDFYNFGIAQMTRDEEYNHFLFETLQMLPHYCTRLNLAENSDDRRKILDEIYELILDRIGQKIGGVRKTSTIGDVISVQEHKATIRLLPHRDLDMLYYFEHINFGFDVQNLINNINSKIMIENNLSNESMGLEEKTLRK